MKKLVLAIATGILFCCPVESKVLNKALIAVKTPFRAVKYIGTGALVGAVGGVALFVIATKLDWQTDGHLADYKIKNEVRK